MEDTLRDREVSSVPRELAPPARRVEITAVDFRFIPNHLSAAPGERLVVMLRNRGTHAHSIAFDLPGGIQRLSGSIRPGESEQFSVQVPRTTGRFAYYCPIDGHRRLGMVGTLTVTRAR